MSRRTAALVTTGALALGGIALLVPPSASAAQAATHRTHHRLLTQAQRDQLRSTGHVTFTRHTRKHGDITILVQRGRVTAVSPTSISLTSKDGYAHTYIITAKTKIREKGQAVPVSDLKVGERAMVTAVQTPHGDLARRISCLRPAPGATPDASSSS